MTPFLRSRRPSLSIPIGTLFGIPIRAHWTFPLVLFWVGALTAEQGQGFAIGAVLTILLFASVVVHELGHALVARRFRVDTHDIVLYPVGGAARLARPPEGLAELAIAFGGPVASFFLGAVLALALPLAGLPFAPGLALQPAPLLSDLVLANLGLFLINLVPAFPLDGGRMLRALLSLRMPSLRATATATMIGQALALAVALIGLVSGNLLLVLLAVLVFFGAAQEAAVYRRQAILAGRSVRDAMVTEFRTLAPQQQVEAAARLLLRTPQSEFPVVDAWGRARGILRRGQILGALATRGRKVPVMEVMDRDVTTVRPRDLLTEVALEESPLVVTEDDDIVGLVTLDSVEDLAALLLAQSSARR